MTELVNLTTATTRIRIQEPVYDDNNDIIWPTMVGIFVALALGWMICRYKCSSEERSPHNVQCCPKSLCKRIRLCCLCLFSLCRFKNEPQQPTSPSSRMPMNRPRPSNNSIFEIPSNSHSILTFPNQQWPPSFILNNNPRLLSPLLNTTINSSQPKRHPLRRESILIVMDDTNERRHSAPWPFPTTNMIFHEQTNQIKKNSIFFNT